MEIELPGCEPGVSFVVDRVASELFVEDGNHFYMVETFTRNIHVGDSDSVHHKVSAQRVAEMFRDIRPSGGGWRPFAWAAR